MQPRLLEGERDGKWRSARISLNSWSPAGTHEDGQNPLLVLTSHLGEGCILQGNQMLVCVSHESLDLQA